MISLLEGLEALGGYGYTAVGEALLDLGFKDRDQLAAGFSRAVSHAQRASGRSELVRFPSILVEFRPSASTFEECKEAATSLRLTHGRDALIFSLNGHGASSLAAWGYSKVGEGSR
jgi:hypothetical protein